MNEALLKHEIYNKLARLSGAELNSIADFIDYVQHKKQLPLKNLKLQGVLVDYDLDLSELNKFKQGSWQHLEGEFDSE